MLLLSSPLENIPNLGPAQCDLLKKNLGIFTVGELLQHYPYRYIDKSRVYGTHEIIETTPLIQLFGTISDIRVEGEGPKRRLVADLDDAFGEVQLVWFQSIEWHKKNLKEGQNYLVFGKPSKFGRKYSISHPELRAAKSLDEIELSGLQSIYTTSESMKKRGMDSAGLGKLIAYCFKNLDKNELYEYLPESILQQFQLITYPQASYWIHFPKNFSAVQAAQRRIKFEEFFRIQIQLQQSLHSRKTVLKGYEFPSINNFFNKFYHHHLPFQLTGAQKKVLKEIRKDVTQGAQMNRLVQGDVGSGKTVVALMSMLMAIDNGFQACMMAPTEILAQQHFEGLRHLVEPMQLQIRLLTGSTKATQKRKILDELEHGKVDIVVGTHALIEPKVVFRNLGLAVIDEQHRFGVAQRAQLWQKNERPPHILVMTATPIPRTLAMTLYGDLDISVIDELPPGRKPISTKHVYFNRKAQLYQFIKDEMVKGYQTYIVFPLIEESEKLDLKNLLDGFEEIKKEFSQDTFPAVMVHGRMKAAEKESEMQKFISGAAKILVSTTVIEVGVNVPNATVMVIINAERFGLSQLHQLRGRVGRGGDQSYCFLLTDYNLNFDGRKRMEIMTSTTDGFVIAEADLKMRGPGDIAGTKQSGDVQLKLANIAEDAPLLELSQKIAKTILEEDPRLELEKHHLLRKLIAQLKKNSEKWGKIS